MIPQETAVPVNTTFWQGQYRSAFTKNWTALPWPFDTEEDAVSWYEREITEPNRISTELRIVMVTTTVTLITIRNGTLPRK